METVALSPDNVKRLERMKNRRTLYELAAVHDDGRRVLIAYCTRRTRNGIWSAVTRNGRREAVVSLCGTTDITFATKSRDGATMGEWRITWTGRTEREAILGAELPYVAEQRIGGAM